MSQHSATPATSLPYPYTSPPLSRREVIRDGYPVDKDLSHRVFIRLLLSPVAKHLPFDGVGLEGGARPDGERFSSVLRPSPRLVSCVM